MACLRVVLLSLTVVVACKSASFTSDNSGPREPAVKAAQTPTPHPISANSIPATPLPTHGNQIDTSQTQVIFTPAPTSMPQLTIGPATIGDGGSDWVQYFSDDGLNLLNPGASPQLSPGSAVAALATKMYVSSGDGAGPQYQFWLFHTKKTSYRITTDAVAQRNQYCSANEVVVGHPPRLPNDTMANLTEATVLCAALIPGLKTTNQQEVPYAWDFGHTATCPGSSVQVGHKCGALNCNYTDNIALICADIVPQ